MKGVIAMCMAELVSNKFGQDKWELILEKTGLDKNTRFLAPQDIEDKTIMEVIRNIGETLHLSLIEIADAFGDYWMNEFAPKIYTAYFTGVISAKEFLMKMDHIHDITTKNIPNACPPKFEYEWKDEKTLIMTYISPRGLIDIMIGLIKGVGKHYKENLKVSKISDTQVKVVFSKWG